MSCCNVNQRSFICGQDEPSKEGTMISTLQLATWWTCVSRCACSLCSWWATVVVQEEQFDQRIMIHSDCHDQVKSIQMFKSQSNFSECFCRTETFVYAHDWFWMLVFPSVFPSLIKPILCAWNWLQLHHLQNPAQHNKMQLCAETNPPSQLHLWG